jgi:hypothetical protein
MEVQWERGRRRPTAHEPAAVGGGMRPPTWPSCSVTMELEPHAHPRATTKISVTAAESRIGTRRQKQKIQKNNRVNIVRQRAARAFARHTCGLGLPATRTLSRILRRGRQVGSRRSSPPLQDLGQHVCQQHVQTKPWEGRGGATDMVRYVTFGEDIARRCLCWFVCCAGGGGGEVSEAGPKPSKDGGRLLCRFGGPCVMPKGNSLCIYPPHDHVEPISYVLSLCGRRQRFDRSRPPSWFGSEQRLVREHGLVDGRRNRRDRRGLEAAWIARRRRRRR